jgi:hypothetical protein
MNMRSVYLPRAGQVAAGALLVLLAAVAPARAQYGRPSMEDPAIGEKYHVEAELNFFNPDLEATVSSESLGIVGSEIDVKSDLGYVDKTIREFRFVLRPAARNTSFRIAYTPVKVRRRLDLWGGRSSSTALPTTVGLPIQTQFKWNTWRFGYEYDFVYNRPRLRRLHRRSAADRRELRAGFARGRRVHARARGRFRPSAARSASIPSSTSRSLASSPGSSCREINDYKGDFFDLDIYGTYNFTHNFGVKGGYRTLDASYLAKHDNGSLKLKACTSQGWYGSEQN